MTVDVRDVNLLTWPFHWIWADFVVSTNVRCGSPRDLSSDINPNASIVLPRPTLSAMTPRFAKYAHTIAFCWNGRIASSGRFDQPRIGDNVTAGLCLMTSAFCKCFGSDE